MHFIAYKNLATYEKNYWWFVCKRRLVKQCIQQYASPNIKEKLILDIGCGTGATLQQHRLMANVAFGLDYAVEALKVTQQTHPGYIGQANLLTLPLEDNSIDLITVLDVLYHQWIIDDELALTEIYRVLKPKGLFILTDSAFNFLHGPHDRLNLTARRYTVPQMRTKLHKIGFKIQKASYTYALFFPIVLIKRLSKRLFAANKLESDLQPIPEILNLLLQYLFRLELLWLKIGYLPWGSSVLFVSQK